MNLKINLPSQGRLKAVSYTHLDVYKRQLLYGILGLGIYMTFRILDFPDLTTEGSFPLGGAVAVTLMN